MLKREIDDILAPAIAGGNRNYTKVDGGISCIWFYERALSCSLEGSRTIPQNTIAPVENTSDAGDGALLPF